MSQNDTKRYIDYPKIELHRHLEGSVRLSTLMELSKDKELQSNQKAASDYYQSAQRLENLAEFIERFMRLQKVIKSYEVIERITYECCEDAANENIRALEIRYAPSFINMDRDLSFDKIHEAVLKGVKRAEKDFPIAVCLIGTLVRSQSVKEASYATDFFIEKNDEYLCAIDLADQEVGFDCRLFTDTFMKAKKAGLKITCHSGEEDVPQAPQFVRDAIDYLGADRIGHGLQIVKDWETMQYIKSKGVCLELCPTSNYLTNNCEDLKQHPLKKLYDFGIATTINSDDPDVFAINLSNEWRVAEDLIGLSLEDIQKMQKIAIEHSFIPKQKIDKNWTS